MMENLQPKLRFPEFKDKWNKQKVGDKYDVCMCKRIFANETNTVGDVPFFKIGTLGNKPDAYISRKLFEEYKSKYKFPNKGDILITCSGTVGKTVVFDGNDAYFQDSNIVWLKNERNEIQNQFLYRLLNNINWSKLNSTTITRIYSSDLKNLIFKYPSLPEQTKIADFLGAVDKQIETLNTKKEKLTLYKKGVMQKLFSQEIRFTKEDGTNYPEWQEKTLGEIATFFKGKSISKADIDIDGNLECVRYGELYTYYKEIIYEVKSKTNLDIDKLFLSKKNDVIIPASGETAIDLSTASCIMKDGIALGGDINVIRTNQNGIFLSYYLNNNKKNQISSLAQGSSVIHIYSNHLKLLKLNIPSLEEQTKIADFLSAIDNQIEAVNNQITKTENYKKGLLQQMFV